MNPEILSKEKKLSLKSDAHHLKPVVIIGQEGITQGVLKEIDVHLTAHNLIKIKMLGQSAQLKEQAIQDIEDILHGHIIQSIGKLLVAYREGDRIFTENQPSIINTKKTIMPAPREVKVRKTTRGTRRNPLKTLTVLGNQRITMGGLVKRKKIRQISKKKLQS